MEEIYNIVDAIEVAICHLSPDVAFKEGFFDGAIFALLAPEWTAELAIRSMEIDERLGNATREDCIRTVRRLIAAHPLPPRGSQL